MVDIGKACKILKHGSQESDLLILTNGFQRSVLSKSIRLISLSDDHRQNRAFWIKSHIPDLFEYTYHENDSNFLSIAEKKFDILIISGNDFKRIKSILQKNAAALVNRLKICLTNRSTPPERAELIMAGFDDVIDITRMGWEEFCARLASMHQRLSTTMAQNAEHEHERMLIARICGNNKLNEKEKNVLLAMIRQRNFTTSAIELRHILCKSYAPVTILHLRVFLSNLRKKLADNVFIKAVSGGKYGIFISE